MTDVELTVGDASLAIDLSGGGIRALRSGSWDVIAGYAAGTTPHGRRGHVLMPWPNRIFEGRYTFGGRSYELPITDEEHRSATHGLVDNVPWTHTGGYQAEGQAEASVEVAVEPSDGYPFRLRLGVTYVLRPSLLEVVVSALNVGREAAPFGAGMHPYFAVAPIADVVTLELPVSQRLPLDEMGAPAGPLEPFDGAVGAIGGTVFDTALTGLVRDEDGWARATLGGPLGTISLSVDGSWRWLQVFTADTLPDDEKRRSVAVEPMSCPPNAFQTGTDVVALEPGETWRGTWRLAWNAAAAGDPGR